MATPIGGRRGRRARDRQITRIFFAFWLVWGLVLIGLRVARPGIEIGYVWNESHVLTASDWFDQHGYRETLAIPPRETARQPDGTWNLYTTYPAGVFWFHELRKAAGLHELWQHRLVLVIWNHAAVALLFLLTRRATGSAGIAAIAASVYMLSGPYVTSAGGLWEHVPMLTLMGTLAAWINVERAQTATARRRWLAIAAGAFVLDNLFTVQHAPMVGLFVAARAAWWWWRARARGGDSPRRPPRALLVGAIVLLAVPPAVLATRFAVHAHIAGGWRPALRSLQAKVEQRAGFTSEAVDPAAMVPTVAARAGLPVMKFVNPRARQGVFPFLAVPALAGALVLLLASLPVRGSPHLYAVRRGLALGGGLVVASLSWPILFPQHTIIHPFVTLMMMPGGAITVGAVAALPSSIRRAARDTGRPPRPLARLALLTAAAAVIVCPMSSIRVSQLINAVIPAEPSIHAYVKVRRARIEAMREAAPVVQGAEFIKIVGNPVVAYALRMPYLIEGPGSRPPRHDDASIVAYAPGDSGLSPKQIDQIFTNWGPPRFLSRPGDLLLYGRGMQPPPGSILQRFAAATDAAGDHASEPISIQWMSFAPTLDGRAWKCAVFVRATGPKHAGEGMKHLRLYGTMELTCHRARGEPFTDQAAVSAVSISSDTGVLVLRDVPTEIAADWTRIEMVIRDAEKSVHLRIAADRPAHDSAAKDVKP